MSTSTEKQMSRWAVRLDLPSLQSRLACLGMESCFYRAADEDITGLTPRNMFCEKMCRGKGHCRNFLSGLAKDHLADPTVRSGSCVPGTFTVVAPLCNSGSDASVVLGCFLSEELGPSEELTHAASRVELDHEALLECVAGQTRHQAEDLECLSDLLAQISGDFYLRRSQEVNQIDSLSRSLAETYEELSFTYKLNNAMNITAGPQEYFQQVAEEFRELLAVKSVLVAIFPEALAGVEQEECVIYSGVLCDSAEKTMAKIRDRILPQDHWQARTNMNRCPTYSVEVNGLGQILSAPILRSERPLGIIAAVEALDGRRFDNIDCTRLSSVANSAAVFLENFRLYGGMHELFLGSLRALTSSIDAKDPYTSGHSERVGLIGKRLIEILGMPAAEADRVYLCGLLHDIGKIGVPENVLRKPGRLTPYEFELVTHHSAIGAKIISGIREMEDLVPAVLGHHERMDGLGYPDGLAGDQIPFRARVLCVADSLDAMTSDRPYRKALPLRLAEAELFRGAGTQFDPALVAAIPGLNLSEYLVELRKSKTSYVPDNIYEPIHSLAGELAES